MFFRKKKRIEELEREVRIVREEFERDRGEKIYLQNELEKVRQSTINNLIEENQKLIEWIEKILEVAQVCKTNEGLQMVNIPIIGERIKSYDSNWESNPVQRKEIIIPAIRFTRIDSIV